MKIAAIGFLVTLLAACATTPAPIISQPSAKAKNYLATTLPDGSIEIIVTGKAGLPTGSQVAVINLRDKLETAAAQECPDGYDLAQDKTASLSATPGGRGFIAKQRGIARCK